MTFSSVAVLFIYLSIIQPFIYRSFSIVLKYFSIDLFHRFDTLYVHIYSIYPCIYQLKVLIT